MVAESDIANAMCLACSSSIQSKKYAVHVTKCCNQVICDSCIRSNPRLATYDPCLACLNGIGASRGNSLFSGIRIQSRNSPSIISNDEDMFVLGYDSDDDETEEQEKHPLEESSGLSPSEPPTYEETVNPCIKEGAQPSIQYSDPDVPPPISGSGSGNSVVSTSTHARYYINSRDTIHGIALRFGVDARELCQRNNLPFGTLNTTPHLLHTRTFLELPQSSKPVPLQYVLSEKDQANREARRAKEQAEKRLQMVTKEIDWRVAKAYVALAETPDITGQSAEKGKKGYHVVPPTASSVPGSSGSDLAIRAVDMYLDDEKWEQDEVNAGNSSQIWKIASKMIAPTVHRAIVFQHLSGQNSLDSHHLKKMMYEKNLS
ncbi:hypothetical protein AGABI2DRAFT_184046 [Agaricus bisporus var. bisporus H97]|uniref:hypothetical protein n=1 Tax=Agaricus bisporus var. bisporus (strain H97 / ATCC MYA-4626 / FGSC 10389) TaxID=936046 RepID=UPI00029F7521|nr:hypothetical protein AGABI2DRAFT_184046 [Agaricus bisporus var. bisporus H97]EKV49246.1 hypothetical protein AGABI2DRAFT_184046 [Agaricus bisporus var. bisporus H97]